MKIGVIGGIGPESTVDYYKLIIKGYRDKMKDGNDPEIIINSINMNKMFVLLNNNEKEKLIDYLSDAVKSLADAGAHFAIMSANTPHMVFEEVKAKSSIPMLSIVEETFNAVSKRGLKKVGLFGTRFTMKSDFYQKVFEQKGIHVVVPNQKEQEYIHNKLMSEIELGVILEETKNGLLAIVQRLIKDEAIEGLILGCTELPLILTKDEFGISFFNTSAIHAISAVDFASNYSKS